jgi:hypothetical protein
MNIDPADIADPLNPRGRGEQDRFQPMMTPSGRGGLRGRF